MLLNFIGKFDGFCSQSGTFHQILMVVSLPSIAFFKVHSFLFILLHIKLAF